jgi:acetyltransferase-like isoleucine patch superfamily enzyme
MEFGLSKIAKYISLRMLLLQLERQLLNFKFRNRNLKLSISCNIRNSNIGRNNFLGENVSLINSTIGDYSYINTNSKVSNTIIGKFCSIGPNVQIVLGSHPSKFVSSHPIFYANNKPFRTFSDEVYFKEYEEVVIGNDVWIAEGVLIPGGVKIGDGAIIMARAVVTKDVEPYSIVGGIPAKHIKYRFDVETINRISQSEWWDWEEKKLRENYKKFHDPEHFGL